jgi:hypothetical protein
VGPVAWRTPLRRIENAVRTIRERLTMRPDQVQSFAETAVIVYCPNCADQLGVTPSPLGSTSVTVDPRPESHPGNRVGPDANNTRNHGDLPGYRTR